MPRIVVADYDPTWPAQAAAAIADLLALGLTRAPTGALDQGSGSDLAP